MPPKRTTKPVSDAVFRAVYDSPASLPGKHRSITPAEDVRRLEELLGMEPETIGAPLWVSTDEKDCPRCGRQVSWLDIVSSSLERVHDPQMVAQVILGNQKYVNVEAPRAIEGVRCFECKNPLKKVRSFKCHNWAYAREAMVKVLEQVEARAGRPG
jgi:hypothetical protein